MSPVAAVPTAATASRNRSPRRCTRPVVRRRCAGARALDRGRLRRAAVARHVADHTAFMRAVLLIVPAHAVERRMGNRGRPAAAGRGRPGVGRTTRIAIAASWRERGAPRSVLAPPPLVERRLQGRAAGRWTRGPQPSGSTWCSSSAAAAIRLTNSHLEPPDARAQLAHALTPDRRGPTRGPWRLGCTTIQVPGPDSLGLARGGLAK